MGVALPGVAELFHCVKIKAIVDLFRNGNHIGNDIVVNVPLGLNATKVGVVVTLRPGDGTGGIGERLEGDFPETGCLPMGVDTQAVLVHPFGTGA